MAVGRSHIISSVPSSSTHHIQLEVHVLNPFLPSPISRSPPLTAGDRILPLASGSTGSPGQKSISSSPTSSTTSTTSSLSSIPSLASTCSKQSLMEAAFVISEEMGRAKQSFTLNSSQLLPIPDKMHLNPILSKKQRTLELDNSSEPNSQFIICQPNPRKPCFLCNSRNNPILG
ncbi:uncharacterized protein G2W53_026547 [Senna tora]|uniref:Uncharacterized protein n=1 Tax=Senna tora TaxID=362788 RepID=A0A834WFS0_9FABA|nr:uncharacterized protein G2W53_026547 [Senna tora]